MAKKIVISYLISLVRSVLTFSLKTPLIFSEYTYEKIKNNIECSLLGSTKVTFRQNALRTRSHAGGGIMKKTALLAVLFVSASLYSTALYAQNLYYVQSVKAKVMSSKSFKAPVLGEVGKGYKFDASGKEGSWVKVKFNDRDGYVSSLVLSTHPPIEKTGVIKVDDEIKQGVRRRASFYTSAAAAQGLTQDDRRRLSKEEKADFDSLDKIECFKVSPEELSRFMEGQQL